MNLVSLLIATSVVKYDHNDGLRIGVALAAVIIVVTAVYLSKHRSTSIAGTPEAAAGAVAGAGPSAEVSAQPGGTGGNGTSGGSAGGGDDKTAETTKTT
jgi:hypothetical protein